MAQLVEPPALGFGSGPDLAVRGIEPHVGLCADSVEPAWVSLSPSLSAPPLLALSLPLSLKINKLKKINRGAWVAQSVECLTPDFSSGHDLTVRGIECHVGLCADSVEPAWDSLPPSVSAPPLLELSQK